jgi:hypothetical protein
MQSGNNGDKGKLPTTAAKNTKGGDALAKATKSSNSSKRKQKVKY